MDEIVVAIEGLRVTLHFMATIQLGATLGLIIVILRLKP